MDKDTKEGLLLFSSNLSIRVAILKVSMIHNFKINEWAWERDSIVQRVGDFNVRDQRLKWTNISASHKAKDAALPRTLYPYRFLATPILRNRSRNHIAYKCRLG
jgi:hypothetical protein